MKTILHVVERLDMEYGGPAYSVPLLAKHLNNSSFENIVVGGYKTKLKNDILIASGIKYLAMRSLISKLGIVPFLFPCFHLKYGKPDFIFFHNLWNGITLAGFLYCKLFRIPYAITPRGSLFDWSLRQGSLRKKIAWNLFQKKMIQMCDFVHATSKDEVDAVKDLVNVEIIQSPNGISLAASPKPSDLEELILKKLSQKKIVFLGRLHEKKNIEAIIEAYSKSNIRNQYSLEIIGSAESKKYMSSLKQLVASKNMTKKIYFRDFISGVLKQELLDTSSLLILASFTENFGVVVLEALSSATPVIASLGTPWHELNEMQAGYWVDCEYDREALVNALDQFSILPSTSFSQMCKNSLKLAEKYKWENCVESLQQRLTRGFENEN